MKNVAKIIRKIVKMWMRLTNKTQQITTSRVIDMSHYKHWGNSLQFLDFSKREITGYMVVKPKIGDILKVEMRSQTTALFKVESVEYMSDPHDMFFGKVRDVGYLLTEKEGLLVAVESERPKYQHLSQRVVLELEGCEIVKISVQREEAKSYKL